MTPAPHRASARLSWAHLPVEIKCNIVACIVSQRPKVEHVLFMTDDYLYQHGCAICWADPELCRYWVFVPSGKRHNRDSHYEATTRCEWFSTGPIDSFHQGLEAKVASYESGKTLSSRLESLGLLQHRSMDFRDGDLVLPATTAFWVSRVDPRLPCNATRKFSYVITATSEWTQYLQDCAALHATSREMSQIFWMVAADALREDSRCSPGHCREELSSLPVKCCTAQLRKETLSVIPGPLGLESEEKTNSQENAAEQRPSSSLPCSDEDKERTKDGPPSEEPKSVHLI